MGAGDHKDNNTTVNKKQQPQVVIDLKVCMDCDGCELKVKNAFKYLKGVKSLKINRQEQKVTVTGNIEQSKVLKKARSIGKNAEIWNNNNVPKPNNNNHQVQVQVAQPYIINAPLQTCNDAISKVGHNPQIITVPLTKFDDVYTQMFSDENPNACSIM